MIAFELVDLFRKLNGNRPGFSQICEASKKLIIVLFSIMWFLLLMHSSPKKRDVEVVGYWECENSKSDVNKNKQKKTTEKKKLEERNRNILFIYIYKCGYEAMVTLKGFESVISIIFSSRLKVWKNNSATYPFSRGFLQSFFGQGNPFSSRTRLTMLVSKQLFRPNISGKGGGVKNRVMREIVWRSMSFTRKSNITFYNFLVST